MIKAICFDLDGVFFTSKGKKSFHDALINEYGGDKEQVDDLMYRSPEMAKLVRGQLTPLEFFNKVREIISIPASDAELSDRWVRDYEVDSQVLEAVKSAKTKGYKTCICTNNNEIRLLPLIERFDLKNLFDVIVSSHEVGETKPSKIIFGTLLERLQVKPDELIYSDDNPERLSGAEELGIKTFLFHDFNQFLVELNSFGIEL